VTWKLCPIGSTATVSATSPSAANVTIGSPWGVAVESPTSNARFWTISRPPL
jgi:hypothetical protein